MKVLDPATGGPVASIVPSGTPDVEQHSGELAPDGSRFVVYRDRASRLWDVESTREIARSRAARRASFSRRMDFVSRARVRSSRQTVGDWPFWPMEHRPSRSVTPRMVAGFSRPRTRASSPAWPSAPTGRLMATISGDDSAIQIWDSQTGRLVTCAITAIFPSFLANPAFSRDGRWLAVMGRFRDDAIWLVRYLSREGPPTILRAGNQGTHILEEHLRLHAQRKTVSADLVRPSNLESGEPAKLLPFKGRDRSAGGQSRWPGGGLRRRERRPSKSGTPATDRRGQAARRGGCLKGRGSSIVNTTSAQECSLLLTAMERYASPSVDLCVP